MFTLFICFLKAKADNDAQDPKNADSLPRSLLWGGPPAALGRGQDQCPLVLDIPEECRGRISGAPSLLGSLTFMQNAAMHFLTGLRSGRGNRYRRQEHPNQNPGLPSQLEVRG